ncbi:MAG: Flp pilus assembly protein CpaB [Planctomycetaceae bacterium]|nr:Flp pilus assembly protein CpaB [Planctomycetaceae bacterium]
MKYTILLLVVLGVIAAVCAMFLVQTMRSSLAGGRSNSMVEVAVMKKSLPAMSRITADAIEMNKMKLKEAPAGYLGSSAQAVGKILAIPVVQGQALTGACLITQGSEAQLAATIEPGMRAVSVVLSNNSVSGGLLYPGCVVDVLATFKLSGSGRNEVKGEAISTTLLYGIQVLAVQGESVISEPENAKKTDLQPKAANPSNRLSVVLLVDPKQAEALQLALDNGSVSLAMRNPLDQQNLRSEATVLNRGQLSKLGSLLGTTVRSAQPMTVSGSPEDGLVIENGQPTEPAPYLGDDEAAEPSSWGVTIIRGSEVKEEELKLAE